MVVLAATFGAAAHTSVGTGHLAAFLIATTVALTLVGAIIAAVASRPPACRPALLKDPAVGRLLPR